PSGSSVSTVDQTGVASTGIWTCGDVACFGFSRRARSNGSHEAGGRGRYRRRGHRDVYLALTPKPEVSRSVKQESGSQSYRRARRPSDSVCVAGGEPLWLRGSFTDAAGGSRFLRIPGRNPLHNTPGPDSAKLDYPSLSTGAFDGIGSIARRPDSHRGLPDGCNNLLLRVAVRLA